MSKNKLREILTVMCIALFAAACGWKIATAILAGTTIAIIYYTPSDDI